MTTQKPTITYTILAHVEPGRSPETVYYAIEYCDGLLNRAYPIANPHELTLRNADIKAFLDRHSDEETYSYAFDLEPQREGADDDLPF